MIIGIFYYSKTEVKNENFATLRLYQEATKRGLTVKYLNFLKFRIKKNGEIYYCGKLFKAPNFAIIRAVYDFENIKIKKLFSFLEKSKNVKVFNKFKAKKIAKNKFSTYKILKRNNLSTPKTIAFKKNLNPEKIEKSLLGFPILLKDANLMKGLGMKLIEDRKSLVDVLKNTKSGSKIFQEFIKEALGYYIRVFVVNGKVIAAREILNRNIDVNIFSNKNRHFSISKEEAELAISATQALQLDYSGVDIIRSKRGPLVLEVNSNPGIKNLEKMTGINIAGMLIEELCGPF